MPGAGPDDLNCVGALVADVYRDAEDVALVDVALVIGPRAPAAPTKNGPQ